MILLLVSLLEAFAAPPDVAAIDAELVAVQTELDALMVQSHAPRRSPEELATLEVHHVEALLDAAEQAVRDRKAEVLVAKQKATGAALRAAKDAVADAKAEVKRRKAELGVAEDAARAAEKEGVPAPTQTPEEAEAEELAIEIATRRVDLLRAQRALAVAQVALDAAKPAPEAAPLPGAPPAAPATVAAPAAPAPDLAQLEAEVAARQADVDRLRAELESAEARRPGGEGPPSE